MVERKKKKKTVWSNGPNGPQNIFPKRFKWVVCNLSNKRYFLYAINFL